MPCWNKYSVPFNDILSGTYILSILCTLHLSYPDYGCFLCRHMCYLDSSIACSPLTVWIKRKAYGLLLLISLFYLPFSCQMVVFLYPKDVTMIFKAKFYFVHYTACTVNKSNNNSVVFISFTKTFGNHMQLKNQKPVVEYRLMLSRGVHSLYSQASIHLYTGLCSIVLMQYTLGDKTSEQLG